MVLCVESVDMSKYGVCTCDVRKETNITQSGNRVNASRLVAFSHV